MASGGTTLPAPPFLDRVSERLFETLPTSHVRPLDLLLLLLKGLHLSPRLHQSHSGNHLGWRGSCSTGKHKQALCSGRCPLQHGASGPCGKGVCSVVMGVERGRQEPQASGSQQQVRHLLVMEASPGSGEVCCTRPCEGKAFKSVGRLPALTQQGRLRGLPDRPCWTWCLGSEAQECGVCVLQMSVFMILVPFTAGTVVRWRAL